MSDPSFREFTANMNRSPTLTRIFLPNHKKLRPPKAQLFPADYQSIIYLSARMSIIRRTLSILSLSKRNMLYASSPLAFLLVPTILTCRTRFLSMAKRPPWAAYAQNYNPVTKTVMRKSRFTHLEIWRPSTSHFEESGLQK